MDFTTSPSMIYSPWVVFRDTRSTNKPCRATKSMEASGTFIKANYISKRGRCNHSCLSKGTTRMPGACFGEHTLCSLLRREEGTVKWHLPSPHRGRPARLSQCPEPVATWVTPPSLLSVLLTLLELIFSSLQISIFASQYFFSVFISHFIIARRQPTIQYIRLYCITLCTLALRSFAQEPSHMQNNRMQLVQFVLPAQSPVRSTASLTPVQSPQARQVCISIAHQLFPTFLYQLLSSTTLPALRIPKHGKMAIYAPSANLWLPKFTLHVLGLLMTIRN